MNNKIAFQQAQEDFQSARLHAEIEKLRAQFTGRSVELLQFDEISAKLIARGRSDKGLRDIPVNAIVGSVSRSADFSRSFLPWLDSDANRWANVRAIMESVDLPALPPIEVYKIGGAYFVKDGHHRVSAARQMKLTYIQAYVTEINTKVTIGPDDSPEDIILKEEYAEFLHRTHIDERIPGADLRVTFPGLYQKLEQHIDAHRYYMGIDEKRPVAYDEALEHWYRQVYTPFVEAIRQRGLLREFPDRTETDLYLWISEHRMYLEKDFGWKIRPEVAADSLARAKSPRLRRVASRLAAKIYETLVPDALEDIPGAGAWRKQKDPARAALFADILVPLSGEESSWSALEQSLILAAREGARLQGLHVIPSAGAPQETAEDAIRERYDRRCLQAGVPGNLVTAAGETAHVICERALLNDLVVVHLAHPPAAEMLARIGSGFRTILRRCARPVLAVPGPAAALERLLLAYDGSPKGKEALFLAAYLAGKWHAPLRVVTVSDRPGPRGMTQEAERYLRERRVEAEWIHASGRVADAILTAAAAHRADLLLMGGYGFSPVVEAVLSSTVDQVLRATAIPVLICQ